MNRFTMFAVFVAGVVGLSVGLLVSKLGGESASIPLPTGESPRSGVFVIGVDPGQTTGAEYRGSGGEVERRLFIFRSPDRSKAAFSDVRKTLDKHLWAALNEDVSP
jgi:hypothetical protein